MIDRRWMRGVLLAGVLLMIRPADAETLSQAMAVAWASNPELAAARARQEALAETPEQARSAGRLTADATGDAGYDHLNYDTSASVRANATLPIWTGARVSSAVRAANGDVAAGAEQVRDAEAAILERVVIGYADLLYNQQAVEVARVGIARLDNQVAEARSRFDLGQATRTDVAQLQAQRASVVANLADAEGALAATQAAYRAVVGRNAGALTADVPPSAVLPHTLDDARLAAERTNPMLLAQHRAAEASAARVDQARAERAPVIDLAGGYGRGVQRSGDGWRGFASAASAGVSLRIPLLTGGATSSRVRQANATWRAERFQTDAATREAVRGADASWANLKTAQARLGASVEGLAAADVALKGVRTEYGFGLRSTLDILVADQSFRGAQLEVARARADMLKAQAALLRATGQLGPDAFD